MSIIKNYLKAMYANKATLLGNVMITAGFYGLFENVYNNDPDFFNFYFSFSEIFTGFFISGATAFGMTTLDRYNWSKEVIEKRGVNSLKRLVNLENANYCDKKGIELAIKECEKSISIQ